MVFKNIDDNGVPTIVGLDDAEMLSWRRSYGAIRETEMLPPATYIDMAVEKLGGHPALAGRTDQATDLIMDIRNTAWEVYVEHEQLVSGQAMTSLLANDPEARGILEAMVRRDGLDSFKLDNDSAMAHRLSEIVGEISGRAFPFIYELAKSMTQSRRSRAGKAFERIIRHIIDAKGFPCDDQSRAGTRQFEQVGLGKIVDGLLPGLEAYTSNRSKCAILTMKTTLRERWQEVVEELERTKVPHIYLLTLDDAVNDSNLDTMKHHNITLVVPLKVQQANSAKQNLISFERLFNVELPHILQFWATE